MESFKKTKEIIEDRIKSNKILKVGVIIGITVFSLYALGHTFNALSHAVDGFKKFKNSIKST